MSSAILVVKAHQLFQQAERYIRMGARMLFTGVDITFKRLAFARAIAALASAAANGES